MAELAQESIPSEPKKAGRHDLGNLHLLGYVTDEELAAALGKSKRALWEDRRRHRGPAFILHGKSILYRITTVQAYLNSLEKGAQPAQPRRVLRRKKAR